jgi:hypothetical protein
MTVVNAVAACETNDFLFGNRAEPPPRNTI